MRDYKLVCRKIKEARLGKNWTQEDLAQRLGTTKATVSKWENGRVPSFEKMLTISKILGIGHSFLGETTYRLVGTEKPIFLKLSGNKNFEEDKLVLMILYFCKSGEVMTKLNKLLFYADFKNFKEHGVSISGCQYAHVPFGPVPNHFKSIYEGLILDGVLAIKNESLGEWDIKKLISQELFLREYFSEDEFSVMQAVKKKFSKMNAADITEFSHKEVGYNSTVNGEIISYEYAKHLQI